MRPARPPACLPACLRPTARSPHKLPALPSAPNPHPHLPPQSKYAGRRVAHDEEAMQELPPTIRAQVRLRRAVLPERERTVGSGSGSARLWLA